MSTYISRIKLVNFRGFELADMFLHPKLSVFLGDNGSGKTSLLQGISILLSGIFPFCDYKPQIKSIPYTSQNIRTWLETIGGKEKRVYANLSGCVGILAEHEEDGNDVSRSKDTILSTAIKKELFENIDISLESTKKEIAQRYNLYVQSGKGVPVFAHYGPHRGAQQGERKRFSRRKVDYTNPFSAYINALHPSLDFDSFLDWFNEEEANELRRHRRTPSFISRELEAVRKALTEVFSFGERRFENPRFETNPKRFVMTAISNDEAESELQFDQLSDGYRGMIALVADFARRLAIANQYTDIDPLKGDGVLIIDEVDAHLHPKWQFRVLDDLRRTFPNVQLIVTTHSPEIVSTVDKESVFILAPENGILQRDIHPEFQTAGNYPQDIARRVMGAPNGIENHPAYQAYRECLAWIQSGEVGSEAFDKSRNIMTKHYGVEHPLTQEVEARLQGLQRKLDMLTKLKRHTGK